MPNFPSPHTIVVCVCSPQNLSAEIVPPEFEMQFNKNGSAGGAVHFLGEARQMLRG